MKMSATAYERLTADCRKVLRENGLTMSQVCSMRSAWDVLSAADRRFKTWQALYMPRACRTSTSKPLCGNCSPSKRKTKMPEFKAALIAPRVNLNGSPKQGLVDLYVNAKRAVETAEREMRQAMPNGRDYQTLPAGTCEAARDAFMERIAMLRKISDELYDVAIAIDQEGGQ